MGFGLTSGFRLGLGLPLDSRGVFAAGPLFGLPDREALCGLPGPREQFVYPRRPVLLRGLLRRGLVLRAGLRGRSGIQLGCALRRPGFPGVDGGLVLAGEAAFDGLEICFEFAPPSGCRLRFLVGLRLRFLFWPGMPAPLEFGTGLASCFPDAAGAGGPHLVSGVAGFEPLPFGGQLRGERLGAGRAGFVVLDFGVCGLP